MAILYDKSKRRDPEMSTIGTAAISGGLAGTMVEGDPEKKDTDYQLMIKSVVGKKGGSQEDYENIMDGIAFHESKYLVDAGGGRKKYKYLDYASKQIGGGPGRGAFMFEEGDNAGGITAVRRTMNYMNNNGLTAPTWLKNANNSSSLDASKLTKEQQRILFLGNYMEHPKANLGKIISGDETLVDFWGNYHQTQNDPEKKANFLADLEKLKTYSPDKPAVEHLGKFSGLLYGELKNYGVTKK
jgi:hypothetical protein